MSHGTVGNWPAPRDMEANGVRLSVVDHGQGPLVLLCHGWPELAFSWRHQIAPLAAAGHRVLAPDLRGFGRSDAPAGIAAYSVLDMVGDLVALVAAAGEDRAVVVGHDWGATIAWTAALLRPDLFRAVAALSVPFRPRGPAPPLQALRAAGQHGFYWLYFQEPGVAEAEFERDPAATIRRLLYWGSGDAPPGGRSEAGLLGVRPGGGFLDGMPDPAALPAWLDPADLDHHVAEYRRTGFRGGLNLYRNLDRNWALLAPWQGARVRQPALFVAGTRDAVIRTPAGRAALDAMPDWVPDLRRTVLLDGAGHWIQQERPAEVTAALLDFLRSLPDD